jgi:GrpB-like predicted nucleotidyltransferase (UPF0157 family)
MGQTVLDIRHIGSTSIVGMPAQPILDILVGLQTVAEVEPFVKDLNLIGYEDRKRRRARTQIFCKRHAREQNPSSEFL